MKQFMKEMIRLDEWKPVDRFVLPATLVVVVGAVVSFVYYVYSNWLINPIIK